MNTLSFLFFGLGIAIIGVAFEVVMDYHRYWNHNRNVPAWRGYVVRGVTWALVAWVTNLPFAAAYMYFGIHFLVFDPVMGWILTGDISYLGDTKRWDRALQKIGERVPLVYLRIMVGLILIGLYFFPNGYLRV